ncbi:KamA family radical SAM protein [Chitinispirillales bacterium ANBcel5]|uniref:KamA family radical SAM protein n=1 Tax=Cellulosispirillum alkaliphilum TaxID=3039283 RepID=UPI002A574A53|nr:KamA family radical SAM protein [Chitinispirillales bacterium ANBcel5]
MFENMMILSIDEMLSRLSLRVEDAPYSILQHPQFPFSVTSTYLQQIKKGDWYDPLLLQILPRAQEEKCVNGYSDDAVGDLSALVAPSLLHKYTSRALLITSQDCAGRCRFCFRRCVSLPASGTNEGKYKEALDYLRSNETIDELLLSGGEPLLTKTSELVSILNSVKRIGHIKTIRIHTRLPVTLPLRIDNSLLALIDELVKEKNCIIVVHVNHAQEIGAECKVVLNKLRSFGVTLLSQTVLLKEINDSSQVLSDLFKTLISLGVIPYYLHQLDRVNGAAHFEVDESRGVAIMGQLRKILPGYAVPRYVKEIAGEAHKTVIA